MLHTSHGASATTALHTEKAMAIIHSFCRISALVSLLTGPQVGPLSAEFTDQTEAAGITFVHHSGGLVKQHIVETMGGGAAFFDADADGDMDLYAVNGATVQSYRQKTGPGNVFYVNGGSGAFHDETASAGVGDAGWGMGCSMGDVDGDGFGDLYVANYGANVLYHNDGDGTFSDVSKKAGVEGSQFTTSTAFFDADNDGDLDLYVATYLAYDIHAPSDRKCTYAGYEIYCGPQGLARDGDVLYRNDGTGTFTDVTRASGVSWANHYYALGVLPADFDGDGDTDIFVANDKTPNLMFHNAGDGTFVEHGLQAAVAYNADGNEEASMGVAAGDYDGDGMIDLYVTHFFRESNTLYRNVGTGTFQDVTRDVGLEQPTLNFLGWGTQFLDFDSDGDLDLFVANGHVYPQIDLKKLGTSYAQKNQLFRNDGDAGWFDVSAEAGPGLRIEKVSRGAAFGDYDNDGDTDVFVVNLDQPATLLRNDTAGGNRLVVQLRGHGANPNAIGAWIRVHSADRAQLRYVSAASSYLSANDIRACFGLGAAPQADRVEIIWPDGSRQELTRIAANQHLLVSQEGDVSTHELALP